MHLNFEDFTLDTGRFELRRGGEAVSCEPKVFDLISLLAASPGKVFTKDELIDAVWEGRIVSDATVSSCVKAARKALGDTGRAQRLIKTVHGRGFLFNGAEVAVEQQASSDSPVPDIYVQPSLMIAPVRVEDGIVTGLSNLADTLRVALGRVPFMTGVPRRTAEALADAGLDEIRSKVGRGYLLDIAVTSHGKRIRAAAELTDTGNGALVWSRSMDVPSDDEASDALVGEILPRLEPALVQANYEALRCGPATGSARPLVIQAFSVLALKGWHGASFAEAEGLLRQALALEPDLAMTRAVLSLILALGQRVGFNAYSQERIEEALAHADVAMAAEPIDSTILGLSGCAISDAGHAERALPILKRAIELNPNNAHAHAAIGATYLSLRELDLAIENLSHGVEISPYDNRLSIWLSMLALAHLLSGDSDTAGKVARRATEIDDKTYLSRVVLTAVHLAQDESDAAKAALMDCLRVKPDLGIAEVEPVIGRKLGAAFKSLLKANTR